MTEVKSRNGWAQLYPISSTSGIVRDTATERRARVEISGSRSLIYHFMPSAPVDKRWSVTCIDAETGQAKVAAARTLHAASVEVQSRMGFHEPRKP